MSELLHRVDLLHHLELLSALDDGLITTASLNEAGFGSRAIERLVADAVLTRIRRGAFVLTSLWQSAWPEARYRWFVRATARSSRHDIVVSHLSAAAMHGLPLVGEWPRTVHILEPTASGGSSAPLLTSHRGAPESETVVIGGVRVTSIERTLADVAISEPFERSIAALDAGLRGAHVRAKDSAASLGVPRFSEQMQLHLRRADAAAREQIAVELAYLNPTRCRRRAEAALAFASPLADGPGESLSRVRFLALGFEIPELQVRFAGADGRDAFVDCYWRRVRKIGEFDGKHKYTRGRVTKPGEDLGEIVYFEKRREDALRTQADSLMRWGWPELLPPLVFDRFLREHEVPRAR